MTDWTFWIILQWTFLSVYQVFDRKSLNKPALPKLATWKSSNPDCPSSGSGGSAPAVPSRRSSAWGRSDPEGMSEMDCGARNKEVYYPRLFSPTPMLRSEKELRLVLRRWPGDRTEGADPHRKTHSDAHDETAPSIENLDGQFKLTCKLQTTSSFIFLQL